MAFSDTPTVTPTPYQNILQSEHSTENQYNELANAALQSIIASINEAEKLFNAVPGSIPAATGEAVDPVNGEKQQYNLFIWRRDAAIIARVLVRAYPHIKDPERKAQIREILAKYVRSESQFLKDLESHEAPMWSDGKVVVIKPRNGEAKRYIDGKLVKDIWGRPQNDGPAYCAKTLSIFAEELIAEGDYTTAYNLYKTLISNDLNYLAGEGLTFQDGKKNYKVAPQYNARSYDIWEEQYGFHFATLVAIDDALVRGAHLAQQLGMPIPLEWKVAISEIDPWIEDFRDVKEQNGDLKPVQMRKIVATLDHDSKPYNNGRNGFDAVEYMAVLDLAHQFHNFQVTASDPLMMKTVDDFRQWFTSGEVNATTGEFEQHFPINHQGRGSTFLGRYPNDKYFKGNVWPIATFASARYDYETVVDASRIGHLKVMSENLEILQRLLGANSIGLHEGMTINAASDQFVIIASKLIENGNTTITNLANLIGINFNLKTQTFTGKLEINEQYSKYDGSPTALPNLLWSLAELYHSIQDRHQAVTVLQEIRHRLALEKEELANGHTKTSWAQWPATPVACATILNR